MDAGNKERQNTQGKTKDQEIIRIGGLAEISGKMETIFGYQGAIM